MWWPCRTTPTLVSDCWQGLHTFLGVKGARLTTCSGLLLPQFHPHLGAWSRGRTVCLHHVLCGETASYSPLVQVILHTAPYPAHLQMAATGGAPSCPEFIKFGVQHGKDQDKLAATLP